MKIIHERLIRKLLGNRRIDIVTNCWLWTGYIDSEGYGRFGVYRYRIKIVTSPHRAIAYICLGFNLLSEFKVLHKCDIRNCFNPLHLFIGTQQDNIRDAGAKGRLGNQYQKNITFDINREWTRNKGIKALRDNCIDIEE